MPAGLIVPSLRQSNDEIEPRANDARTQRVFALKDVRQKTLFFMNVAGVPIEEFQHGRMQAERMGFGKSSTSAPSERRSNPGSPERAARRAEEKAAA